jgi:DNA-binding CsgD family transcriptional regulator
MDRHDALLRLIGEIYETVGNPQRWHSCLQAIGELLNAKAANLLYHDHQNHLGGIVASTLEPDASESYAAYFHSKDPWAAAITAKNTRAGEIIFGQSLVPRPALSHTEFFADFGRRFEVTQALIGVIDMLPNGASSGLSVNRSDRAPEFDLDSARLLAQILPHVKRALALNRRIVAIASERTALIEVLDRFQMAVVLLDQHLNVTLMNAAGSRLAGKRDGFFVHRQRVRGATAVITRNLSRAIASAIAVARGDTVDAGTVRVRLPRPSGGTALDAVVLPVANPNDGGPAAVMFITDPSEGVVISTTALIQSFDFTPVEARVASALAQGHAIKEIAERMQITEQTTRWYVKRVFAKTGTSRQAELVRLLLSTTSANVLLDEQEGSCSAARWR